MFMNQIGISLRRWRVILEKFQINNPDVNQQESIFIIIYLKYPVQM